MPDRGRIIPPGRPLYCSDKRPVGPEEYDPAAHAGLWYDKFCNAWQGPSWRACKIEAKDKLKWISTLTDKTVGDAALLSEYAERRRRMVAALGGRCIDLATASRFVTGLGREHPVENGFAWHPTLGTPYLPGSSVKGLVRAWASGFGSQGASSDWDLILGSPDCAGRVILLDASPLKPVRLEADVTTPHYSDYYQSSDPDQNPPGDWMSPVPIPFLAVASGVCFRFALIPKTQDDAVHLPTVETWLCKALEWLGGGAKTAVGYGRFLPAAAQEVATKISAPPGPASRPRYRHGDQVTARRVEDPKGKGRLWFQADDGFGGTLVGMRLEVEPYPEMGGTVTLEIAATLAGGYNFRFPREKKAITDSNSKGQPR